MSKSTSLAQLQNNDNMEEHYEDRNNMADVDDVMNQLGNSNNDQEIYFENEQNNSEDEQDGQMMAAAQEQQKAQMMAAAQEQHKAQMMAAAQEQQKAQMMAAAQKKNLPKLLSPTSKTQQQPPKSFVEKVVSELKDSLLVLLVFIILNLKPVGQITFDIISKATTNEYLILLIRGLIAGVLFYVVKRIILNQ